MRRPPEKPPEHQERTIMVQAPVFTESGKAWRPFKFKNLEQVSKSQALLIQRLEWLVPELPAKGPVSRPVLEKLRSLFETEVELLVDYVHVVQPKDLPRYLAEPLLVVALAPLPHKARGFLEIELSLAHAAIDLLLGGSGEAVTQRPLTDIEEGVVVYLVLEILKVLSPQIEPGLPRLRLERLVRRLDEVVEALEDEPQLLALQLKCVLGRHSGFLRLLVPSTVVGLASPPPEGEERRRALAQRLERHIGRLSGVKTWLRAEIGRSEISTRQLSALREGDVVIIEELLARTDLGEPGAAILRVGAGRAARVEAELVVEEGRYLARIAAVVTGEEAVEGLGEEAQAPGLGAGAAEEGADAEAPAEDEELDGEGHLAARPTNPSGLLPLDRDRTGIHVEDSLKTEGAELLADIPLQIAVELARLPITAEEVVALRVGEVLDLGKAPGEPVELSVNGKVVGRGELVEVEGHLGVRILSLAG